MTRAGRATLFLVAALAAAGWGATGAVGTLSGSNSLGVSLAGWDFSSLALSDVLTISWRYGELGFASTTTFSSQGIGSEDFRATIPLGATLIQSGAYFTDVLFSRGSLSTSFDLGEIQLEAALLGANLGSVQTPSYAYGTTFSLAGDIPDLLHWLLQVGIGATPSGQVLPTCCFGGATLSVSEVSFCTGTLGGDVVIGQTGPTDEDVSWLVPLPIDGFTLRAALAFAGILEFQSLAVSVAGRLGEASLSGNFSFDHDWDFVQGSWQASGPLLGGSASASVSFDAQGILGLTGSATLPFLGGTATLAPSILIDASDCFSVVLEIPSLRVDFRHPVSCCDGIRLGDVSLGVTSSGGKVDSISLGYTYRF